MDEYLTLHDYQGNLRDAICDALEFSDTLEEVVEDLANRDIPAPQVQFLWCLVHL